jgi:hypothetical protein
MKNILLFLMTVYLMVLLSMYLLQRQMMYFPSSKPTHTNYEVLGVASAGLIVKVMTDNSQIEPAVIYFGGNGEDVYAAAEIMQEAFSGMAAYYVNYLGYGGSTGSPTESSITQASKDVYQYVAARHGSIALVGRNLGTGVVIKLANEKVVSHLELISPYDSIENVAISHYPFLSKWLVKDKFDNISRAAEVNVTTLIILANDDKVISIKHSHNLMNAFKSTTPRTRV